MRLLTRRHIDRILSTTSFMRRINRNFMCRIDRVYEDFQPRRSRGRYCYPGFARCAARTIRRQQRKVPYGARRFRYGY